MADSYEEAVSFVDLATSSRNDAHTHRFGWRAHASERRIALGASLSQGLDIHGAGVTMIQILCSDDRQEVRLERVTGAPARIHIGTHHSLEAILDAVGSELTPEEAQACHLLWSDDATGRFFKHTPEGTLFGFTER
jgi:hypothetical protein